MSKCTIKTQCVFLHNVDHTAIYYCESIVLYERRDRWWGNNSYLDIIAVILNAANKRRGIGKSRLMYKTFLGYARLKEYLPALTEMGFTMTGVPRRLKLVKKVLGFLTVTIGFMRRWKRRYHHQYDNNKPVRNSVIIALTKKNRGFSLLLVLVLLLAATWHLF